MKTVRITGIGMGTEESLTKEASQALAEAREIILTDTLARRLDLSLYTTLNPDAVLTDVVGVEFFHFQVVYGRLEE